MSDFSIDKLTSSHWIMLQNVGNNLVSFDERYEAPASEFTILDELEKWGLVQYRNSETHGYILYYELTTDGRSVLDNRPET